MAELELRTVPAEQHGELEQVPGQPRLVGLPGLGDDAGRRARSTRRSGWTGSAAPARGPASRRRCPRVGRNVRARPFLTSGQSTPLAVKSHPRGTAEQGEALHLVRVRVRRKRAWPRAQAEVELEVPPPVEAFVARHPNRSRVTGHWIHETAAGVQHARPPQQVGVELVSPRAPRVGNNATLGRAN